MQRRHRGCSEAAAFKALLIRAAAGALMIAEGTAVEASTALEMMLIAEKEVDLTAANYVA